MRVLALLTVFFLHAPAATAPSSGLTGVVRIAPATPVCRTGMTCTAPAKHVTLVFAARRSYTVTTDAAGRYRITLAPGRYTVTARTHGRLTPAAVLVRRGVVARRDFALDVGIR